LALVCLQMELYIQNRLKFWKFPKRSITFTPVSYNECLLRWKNMLSGIFLQNVKILLKISGHILLFLIYIMRTYIIKTFLINITSSATNYRELRLIVCCSISIVASFPLVYIYFHSFLERLTSYRLISLCLTLLSMMSIPYCAIGLFSVLTVF